MTTLRVEPKCTCAKWHGTNVISEFSPTCEVPDHRKKAPKTSVTHTPRIKGMEGTLKRIAKSRKRN